MKYNIFMHLLDTTREYKKKIQGILSPLRLPFRHPGKVIAEREASATAAVYAAGRRVPVACSGVAGRQPGPHHPRQ